jgi:hypothetical protein
MEVTMEKEPPELNAQTLLVFGVAILAIALTAWALVVFYNINFVSRNFGFVVVVAYSAAAAGMLVLPAYAVHFGHSRHLFLTRVAVTAFCSWITLEENLHAAEHWQAPPMAMQVASAVLAPDDAKKLALIVFALLLFAVLELLSHFMHHGYHLVHDGAHQLRSKPAPKRRKA